MTYVERPLWAKALDETFPSSKQCAHMSGLSVRRIWPLASLNDLASPVMRPATCLHTDQAWCELAKETQHLATSQLAAHDDMTLVCDTVDLEERLRQVQSDRANLFHGTVLSFREATRPSLGT